MNKVPSVYQNDLQKVPKQSMLLDKAFQNQNESDPNFSFPPYCDDDGDGKNKATLSRWLVFVF